MSFTSDPENQIKIDALANALNNVSVGATLTYLEAEALVSETERQKLGWFLMQARKKIETDSDARFATVRRLGVKRLTTEDLPGIGADVRQTIGRKAKRAFKRLGGLRANDMSQQVQQSIDAERSILGAFVELSKDRVKAKAEQGTQTGPIIAQRVFDLLRSAPAA